MTSPTPRSPFLNAGGVPIFADIDPQLYTLDPHTIDESFRLAPAQLFQFTFGQMADITAICAVAESRQLLVIEDAAQAHGARLYDRGPGSFGVAATYSFYPTKDLGALGDGGAVVSNDTALIERIKISLRQGGRELALQGRMEGRNSPDSMKCRPRSCESS